MPCESLDRERILHFNADMEDEGDPEPVRELKEKTDHRGGTSPRCYTTILVGSELGKEAS